MNDTHSSMMKISMAGLIDMSVGKDQIIGRLTAGAACAFALLIGSDHASAQEALPTITIGARRHRVQPPSAPVSGSEGGEGAPATSASVSGASGQREQAARVSSSTAVFGRDKIGTDRIDTVPRVLDATPNAVFSPQGGPIAIRGIGSLGRTGGVDRQLSVGVFLDDVFIGRPYGIPDFLDGLERVEVIRGPQVTRFGWSTLAGAVNLVSPAPADQAGGSLEGSLGRFRMTKVNATLDAPGAPGSLSAHAFASYGRSGGYVLNEYSGGEILAREHVLTRLSALGQMGDATTLRLNVDYYHTRDDGDIVLSPVEDALLSRANYNFPQYRMNDIGGVSARVTHSFGPFDLTSISALRGFYYDFNLDGDFTTAPLFFQGERQQQQQASQEFRLTSTIDGPLSWMVGGTYMFEHFKAQQFFGLERAPTAPDRNLLDQESNTISGVGQLTWKPLDRLIFAGGLRYTHVTRDAAAETRSPLGFGFFGAPTRVTTFASFNNLSPEFSATYLFDDHVAPFVRVSRGFVPGGISQFIDQYRRPNVYRSATAWTYEAGTKTKWLDDRLAFDIVGFYSDISNLQVVQSLSPTTRIVTNAGLSTSFGMEAEARARLFDEVTLSAGYGYTRAVFDSFVDARSRADYSGQEIPFAPWHSASAALDWRRPINDWVALFGGVQYSYKSSYLFVPNSDFRQNDISLLDARIGADIGPFTISLYGKNLLNDRYLNGYFLFGGTDYGSRALPRTFGVLARATW